MLYLTDETRAGSEPKIMEFSFKIILLNNTFEKYILNIHFFSDGKIIQRIFSTRKKTLFKIWTTAK